MSYFGQEIPKLGFGLMRLPEKDGKIDIAETSEMVDLFLNAGFYYFDTAYGYNDGESELAIKKALVERYPRESFMLATKLPAWAGATKEDAEQMLYTSLERTGAGYFDYYLLHNLGEGRTHFFDDYGTWDFLQQKKKEGLIKHLGFSFHDKADALDKILAEHPEMEFVQLQINYGDWENPTIESRKCYELAKKYGKSIIVMEPVKGGSLAEPPQEIADLLKSANPEASLASWAIRFAASLDGIITVLSGMSSLKQMQDNLSYMKDFKPLNKEEHNVLAEAQKLLEKYPTVPCTACAYCMKDCPAKVAIYGTFQAVNIVTLYNNMNAAKGQYVWNTAGAGLARASECIQCGRCEQVCPQHIKIREELSKAVQILEG